MYTTDLISLPTFLLGRHVYPRLPELMRPLGTRFAVVGGVTAMEKALPKYSFAADSMVGAERPPFSLMT